MTSQMQRWRIEWSSATGSGNTFVEYPDHLNRTEVIKRWESAHYGCYVDRLFDYGGGRYAEAKDDSDD